MDLGLKPWDQNGGRITEEDKIILRAMRHMHNEAQKPSKEIGKKGKHTTANNDAEIRNKLINLGYGVPRKKRK